MVLRVSVNAQDNSAAKGRIVCEWDMVVRLTADIDIIDVTKI